MFFESKATARKILKAAMDDEDGVFPRYQTPRVWNFDGSKTVEP